MSYAPSHLGFMISFTADKNVEDLKNDFQQIHRIQGTLLPELVQGGSLTLLS